MKHITKFKVAEGIFYVSIPQADVHILCGCPADSVKHLLKRGLIQSKEVGGVTFETGPNAILLSDVLIQDGRFTNLSEFPILHMFYRQGRIIPGHPNNTGAKPALIGSRKQVEAQMEYIYRGNYGLVSEEELVAAGVEQKTAKEWMRLKLRFAFGKIRRMEEYLDLVMLENDIQEIHQNVFVKRLKTNVFEISYGRESVRVDLNFPAQQAYLPSYQLGFHHIKRDFFSVLHSGEGDGWDPNRPAMSSIIIFQGKVYLIDAGPHILHSLRALGISVNEISGIFHTHAHDDHFCGLPALMRADHRIPYYATSFVRASVMKKLAALAMTNESEFEHYFRFHDLELGQWNDIDTLEVKPVFSPHPVETTVMIFRTMDRKGYRSYAHFADIASLKLLKSMVTEDENAPGLSQELYDQVCRDYAEPADLKKLDIGGGMIHGDAEDFARDKSEKLVLSHTALPLTYRQKEIGSGAPFGMVDVLIPTHQDYVRSYAYHFLNSYFPTVAGGRLRVLLNNQVVKFNPESLILKSGRKPDHVHLILTGQVDVLRTRLGISSTLTTGALMGEHTALTGKPAQETYRAASFVQALAIPSELYATFVKTNGLYEEMLRLQDIRTFLSTSRLFGGGIGCTRQNAIASAITMESHGETDAPLFPGEEPRLCLVKSGTVDLYLGSHHVETISAGDFYNESTVLFETPSLFKAKPVRGAVILNIPGPVLADIPVVRWKLLEIYERRLSISAAGLLEVPRLQWLDEFCTGNPEIDAEHRNIFEQACSLYDSQACHAKAGFVDERFSTLLASFRSHIKTEHALMKRSGYPGYENHRRKHEHLLKLLEDMFDGYTAWRVTPKKGMGNLLRDWVMNHIVTEDRQLGFYLNKRCKS